MTSVQGESDLDYPQLLAAAERASGEYQSTFFRAKAVELGALTLGAVFGLLDTQSLWGAGPILAVVMFAAAVGLEISRYGQVAERRWYDARAAAESIKSASWQYAVGGEAFRLGHGDMSAAFIGRLHDVLSGLPHLDIGAATAVSAGATPDMQQLRAASQTDRYNRYLTARIEDQVHWYSGKAKWNKTRARFWRLGLIACEGTALILGLLRINHNVNTDLLGVFSTAGAGLVAWIQAKNFTYLAESYAVTSHEVGLVAHAVRADVDEDRWAQSIHDAEAAFSREHTMWVARKQGAP